MSKSPNHCATTFTRNRSQRALVRLLRGAAAATAAATVSTAALAQPSPSTDTRPSQPPSASSSRAGTISLSGSIQQFNVGPRGNPESFMLKTADKTVQLNYPPDVGATIAAAVNVGDTVQATAAADTPPGPPDARRVPGGPPPPPRPDGEAGDRPDGPAPDHEVRQLVSLAGPKGKVVDLAAREGAGPAHVEGTVKQLNYGHRGEINGVVLDSGDVVHTGPRAAASLKLTVGAKVSTDGPSHPMPNGHQCIAADTVNGTAVQHPGGPDGGRAGRRPPPDAGANDNDGPPPPNGDGPRGGRSGPNGRPRRGPGGNGGNDQPPPPPAN